MKATSRPSSPQADKLLKPIELDPVQMQQNNAETAEFPLQSQGTPTLGRDPHVTIQASDHADEIVMHQLIKSAARSDMGVWDRGISLQLIVFASFAGTVILVRSRCRWPPSKSKFSVP